MHIWKKDIQVSKWQNSGSVIPLNNMTSHYSLVKMYLCKSICRKFFLWCSCHRRSFWTDSFRLWAVRSCWDSVQVAISNATAKATKAKSLSWNAHKLWKRQLCELFPHNNGWFRSSLHYYIFCNRVITCLLPPRHHLVWQPPPCIYQSLYCRPAASVVSPHGLQLGKRNPLTVEKSKHCLIGSNAQICFLLNNYQGFIK